MYNIGIIGAGIIGTRLALSFDKHPKITIKIVCDIDLNRAKILADKYNASSTDDINDILSNDIDLVYIGVPPKYHSEIAIKTLNAGKHIILEKPIALNKDEIDKMIDAKGNLITAINLPFRFEPGINRLKEELNKNSIGKIRMIELRFRFPNWPRKWQLTSWLESKEQGGPLREVGTHYFFALRELFGNIDKILAVTDFPNEYACETRSSAIILLSSGLVCNLSLIVGTHEEMENTLIVYGETGTLSHYMWHKLILERSGIKKVLSEKRFSSEYAMTENFIRAIEGDKTCEDLLVSFEDAAATQYILQDILDQELIR